MTISGIARTDGLTTTPAQIEAMGKALPSGDPAAQSHFFSPEAAFSAGTMPSSSSYRNDGMMVVCEADIFNQRELKDTIPSGPSGGNVASLVADLYRTHGEAFVEQLHGVFSLAIWDEREKKLVLARDRFGVKPLCYAESSSSLVFASYASGVLASGLIKKAVNYRALVDYVNFNVVPAPRTAYEGISKLSPGEYLVWQRGQARRTSYWELRYTEEARGTESQLADELFSRLKESVRLSSDDLEVNQTGCFLSGGTDSSSIAGFFSGLRHSPVKVFSIGFSEQRFDELYYATLAARHFGLTHYERLLGPDDAYEIIPKIVDLFDEPFANASAIPTYACLELARSHGVSTMLAGDGGDELFGGNERYRIHQIYDLYQRVPRPLRKLVEPALFAMPTDRGILGKAKTYVRRSNVPNPERYCRWRMLQVFPSSEVLGDAMPQLNGNLLETVRGHHRGAIARSELNRLLNIDVKMTLGDEDLPKVTRTAEGNRISVRFPFLDQTLADFSGRIPTHYKLKGFEKRFLFKRATNKFLPAQILAKKKHGFGLPIGMWLKSDAKLRTMATDILLSPAAYQRGYFRREFIEKLMANLAADDTPYYGDLLWVFLMLELWHRRHISGNAV